MQNIHTTEKRGSSTALQVKLFRVFVPATILLIVFCCGNCLSAQNAGVNLSAGSAVSSTGDKWESIPAEKQAYIKAHPSDYIVGMDGTVKVNNPAFRNDAVSGGAEKLGDLTTEKQAYIKSHPDEYTIGSNGAVLANSGQENIVDTPVKITMTTEMYNSLSPEKQAVIRTHPEFYEIKDNQ